MEKKYMSKDFIDLPQEEGKLEEKPRAYFTEKEAYIEDGENKYLLYNEDSRKNFENYQENAWMFSKLDLKYQANNELLDLTYKWFLPSFTVPEEHMKEKVQMGKLVRRANSENPPRIVLRGSIGREPVSYFPWDSWGILGKRYCVIPKIRTRKEPFICEDKAWGGTVDFVHHEGYRTGARKTEDYIPLDTCYILDPEGNVVTLDELRNQFGIPTEVSCIQQENMKKVKNALGN